MTSRGRKVDEKKWTKGGKRKIKKVEKSEHSKKKGKNNLLTDINQPP